MQTYCVANLSGFLGVYFRVYNSLLWLSVYIQTYLYQVPFYFFYTCGQNKVIVFDQTGHRDQ